MFTRTRIWAIELCLSRRAWLDLESGEIPTKAKTGCLTAARFATPFQLRVAVYLASRCPLPGLLFRRRSSRRSGQGQRDLYRPADHHLISHAQGAGVSQPHPQHGTLSVPGGSLQASAPCTVRHPPGLRGAVVKSAAPRNSRSTTARAVVSFNASCV